MSLSRITLEKLREKYFPEGTPIVVPSAEKEAFQQQLAQVISCLEDVEMKPPHPYHRYHTHYQDSEKTLETLVTFDIAPNIKNSGEIGRYSLSYAFSLYLSKTQDLYAIVGSKRVAVISIAELKQFIQACHNKLQQQALRRIKTSKQKSLKIQAVLAQCKKIAKEEQFNFALETDTVKIKLYVEITEQEWVVLWIPFKHYQVLLPKIQETLKMILTISHLGVVFKMNTQPSSYNTKHYKYKDL